MPFSAPLSGLYATGCGWRGCEDTQLARSATAGQKPIEKKGILSNFVEGVCRADP